MKLWTSKFLHLVPVGEGRVLLIHALSGLKLVLDVETGHLIEAFQDGLDPIAEISALTARFHHSPEALLGALDTLLQRDVLVDQPPQGQIDAASEKLGPTFGRDPTALLEAMQRQVQEGGEGYWAVTEATGVARLSAKDRPRIDAILMGDCDIQMEADFLRREAEARGIDLRIAATFPDDVRFAAEHPHQIVLIGALRSRHAVVDPLGPDPDPDAATYGVYVNEATRLIENLRTHTTAPILLDNLPLPTVQPLGMADRGLNSHRNRFRLLNVALAQTVEGFADVHLVDIDSSLAKAGSENLLDDGQVGFTHFGSPGWMLQRPKSELAAVHNIFPDPAPLIDFVGGDPYGREKVLARAHMDAITVALGLGRKKCVILDLDGTLWPGVLAETGAPFAWSPEVSGGFSYIGLYFGLHEALKCLKKRGVVLAAVSKNDEATVRELWKYPDHYPLQKLLTPDDFVAWRVNWSDKVENIQSLAEELGFALDAFLFIDDHPVERDRVRQRLPDVEVWGEDPFSLRRRLLNDPRLQLPRITEEAAGRTDLVKAQLARKEVRSGALSESDYLASLNLECDIRKAGPADDFSRVQELFERTTQFNTTGARFAAQTLAGLSGAPESAVYTLRVKDRFGDHGLVGAAVVQAGEITGLAISCRVLGMGVEHRFLQAVLGDQPGGLRARIIETARNIPVRNLYADNGFARDEDGAWRHP